VAHTTDTGEPCALAAHAPRAEDLVAPAALGTACFAALHDLASALQAIGNAVDELDMAVTDPALRPLVDAAIEANDHATKMFVATRAVLRDPAGRKQPIEVAALVSRTNHQAATKPVLAGAVPAGTVEVAVPVVAMALAKLVDAAAAGAPAGAAPELVARADRAVVALTIRAPAAAPAPESIGATLAIAARAIEAHGGSVACGATDGRATYVVRLPFTAK
jgi:hypothetical protein